MGWCAGRPALEQSLSHAFWLCISDLPWIVPSSCTQPFFPVQERQVTSIPCMHDSHPICELHDAQHRSPSIVAHLHNAVGVVAPKSRAPCSGAVKVEDEEEVEEERPARTCHNCGSKDHLLWQCPLEIICNNCGKKGHTHHVCKKPPGPLLRRFAKAETGTACRGTSTSECPSLRLLRVLRKCVNAMQCDAMQCKVLQGVGAVSRAIAPAQRNAPQPQQHPGAVADVAELHSTATSSHPGPL